VVFWTDSSRVGDLCYLLVGRISYQDDHSDATDHAALRSRRPSHRPAAGRALRLSDHTAALHRPTNCTRPVCRRHSAGSRQPKRGTASLPSGRLTANAVQDSKAHLDCWLSGRRALAPKPFSPEWRASRLDPTSTTTAYVVATLFRHQRRTSDGTAHHVNVVRSCHHPLASSDNRTPRRRRELQRRMH
jgi:hypothetical protein